MTLAFPCCVIDQILFSLVRQKASIGNGVTAILAGIVSQILEDSFGQIGPFQGAIALTVLALLMILSWEENYGESTNSAESSLFSQFALGWKTTVSHPQIWKIGLVQALSEGAMYTVSGLHHPFNCVVLTLSLLLSVLSSWPSLCSCGCQHCFFWTLLAVYPLDVSFLP